MIQVKVDDVIREITNDDRDKAEDELKKGIPFTAVKVPANGVVVIETPDTVSGKGSEKRSCPSSAVNPGASRRAPIRPQ